MTFEKYLAEHARPGESRDAATTRLRPEWESILPGELTMKDEDWTSTPRCYDCDQLIPYPDQCPAVISIPGPEPDF